MPRCFNRRLPKARGHSPSVSHPPLKLLLKEAPFPSPRSKFRRHLRLWEMERDGIPHSPWPVTRSSAPREAGLTGRIPSAEEVQAFVSSTDPAKRDRLIDHTCLKAKPTSRSGLTSSWRFSSQRQDGTGPEPFPLLDEREPPCRPALR